MTPALTLVCILLGAYLIGAIPFGLIIGKMKGVNIREHGSGNIGATNVLRVLGKPLGITCFVLDFGKGLVPVLLAQELCRRHAQDWIDWLPLTAVFATVLGHVFSCFVNFKGGKGVATSAGAIMAVAPLPTAIALIVWLLVFRLSGYVSLGSIVAAIALPLCAVFQGRLYGSEKLPLPSLILFAVMAILVIWLHRANIARLRQGTESSFKRKNEAEESK
ncbi:MAG: glycerol-3-phosphate 1-O-acyltransferase PlsY [Verrucomicrobiota bacterium]|jgi:glycerol-3-phosphate acyltransferase PlsY